MATQSGRIDAGLIAGFARRVARNPSSDRIVTEAVRVLQAVANPEEIRIVHSTPAATWREWLARRDSVEVREHDECPAPRRNDLTVRFDAGSPQAGFISARKRSAATRELLELLAPQMWTAFLLESALERVQNASVSETGLVRETMRARDEERRRIARELHDDLGQSLASLKLSLKWAEDLARRQGVAPVATEIEAAREAVGGMMNKIRDLSHTLYPRILETLGLASAIREMVDEAVRRSGLRADCITRGRERPLDKETAVALYRCCQEAVHNALKHAAATRLRVEIRYSAGEIRVLVEDDGRGFNPHDLYNPSGRMMSSGFWTIRQRMADLNGAFRLSTAQGQGTVVEFSVPVRSRERDAKRTNQATHRR